MVGRPTWKPWPWYFSLRSDTYNHYQVLVGVRLCSILQRNFDSLFDVLIREFGLSVQLNKLSPKWLDLEATRQRQASQLFTLSKQKLSCSIRFGRIRWQIVKFKFIRRLQKRCSWRKWYAILRSLKTSQALSQKYEEVTLEFRIQCLALISNLNTEHSCWRIENEKLPIPDQLDDK